MANLLLVFLFLQGNPDPEVILTLQACGSCHAGTLAMSSAEAFSIEDPDNGFSEVDEYVPGENYRLHLRFNPILSGGNYQVAYKMGAFDKTGTLKKGTLGDPDVPAVFEFNMDESYVAAVVTTPVLAEAEDIYLDWTAPEDGRTVVFSFMRVESNGSSTQGGDRGSSVLELVELAGPVADDDEGQSSGSGSGSGSGTSGGVDNQNGSSSFGSNFSAGCSVGIPKPFSFPLSLVLGLIALLGVRRFSAKNS